MKKRQTIENPTSALHARISPEFSEHIVFVKLVGKGVPWANYQAGQLRAYIHALGSWK